MRRRRLEPNGAEGLQASGRWFELGSAHEAALSEAQQRLLEAARERLNLLSPNGMNPSDSWAAFEPGYGSTEEGEREGALWLCIPIPGKRHHSLQLGLFGTTIVGGWQDRHYAWDYPRGERFRTAITAEQVEAPIEQALDWLEAEMRSHRLIE